MTVMVLKVFFVALLNVLNMSEFTVIFDSEQDSIRSYIHAFKESARHKHVRLFRTDQNYPVDQNYIIIMNNESDFRHIQALQKHQYFPRTLAVLRESLNCNQTLDIDIRIDHELYIYCPLAKKVVEQYTVNDIVKTMPIGEYSEAKQSWSWINERIWDRRNNLQGLDLDAYVLDNKPDSMVGRTRELIPPDPEKVMVEEAWGAFPETGRLLGEKLNFTLSLYQRKDERWGIASSNGTYDGMLGDLVSGKIDFLPLGYTITTERLTSMDFVFSLTTDSAALFVKKESQDKIRWLLYFEPFSYSLWNALVVSSVIFTCLAIFQYLWASKFQSMSLLASVRFGLSVLWITFAVYFGRRLSRFPKHVLLKGTLFAGLFVGNFVFISYRASLTSTLSVPSPIVPFTTLKEFLMSDYRIIIPGGDSHEERLKTAKVTSEERAIWENKIEPGGDKNIAEDMKSAYDILRTNPKVALYHDILPLEALMTERERCEFIKAWISPSSTHISMVLAKHSPYTKIFSRALLKIVQEGMFQREEFKFSSQFSANCDQVTTVAEEVELGMSKICTGFFILLGGMALAVLTMMCELGTGGTRRYLFAELLEPEETKNTLMNQLEWLDRWIKFKSYEDEYQAIDLDDLEAKLDSISGSIMGARLMAKMLKKKKK